MTTAFVIAATVLISVLAVVTNTPREAWRTMINRVEEDWKDVLPL
jgi:hypothetical protein